MAQEASKSAGRYKRFLTGKGIDIGCGADPVASDAFCWDKEQGDAQKLEDLPDELFDYVFSSHTLEHMHSPLEALLNWWRVLCTGGHMVVLVPEEDLYEQRCWPSVFNDDHKTTWAIYKTTSWSVVSQNLLDLIKYLPNCKLIIAETLDRGYRYDCEGVQDQTVLGAEASIGLVLRKLPPPGEGLTMLEQSYRCPKCDGELILRGKLRDAQGWSIRCTKCDVVGKMSV